MKKSTLALSIAAALGGMGLAGTASAMTTLDTTGTAASLELNARGIGHQLVFPYYSVQGNNATLLSIVNTDTTNGKLVKVRFRGAANSDDVYDFQVLMSPGDVWTGAVSKNATNGRAKLTTSDNTCVLPKSVKDGLDFVIDRVDPLPDKGDVANQTREGYVEVLNMADIISTTGTGSALFKTIKHSATGSVTCNDDVLEAALGTDTDKAGYVNRGFGNPTGGLMGDWIILSQSPTATGSTAAWSGAATALRATGSGIANMVIWPQKFGDAAQKADGTSDPIFTNNVISAQQYDLPDMSTPYIGNESATARASSTAGQLAVKGFAAQYVTSDDIAAVTDILFSQPTRRYHAAVNYTATSTVVGSAGSYANTNTGTKATTPAAIYSNANGYYEAANTVMLNRQLCVNDVNMPGANKARDLYDRSEITPDTDTPTTIPPFVISPNIPATPSPVKEFLWCGETVVLSINTPKEGTLEGAAAPNGLSASVARNEFADPTGVYQNGWLFFTLDKNSKLSGNGYPVIGYSFVRATNGAANYGFTYPIKIAR